MKLWFLYALLALCLWGLWGFFHKAASHHLQPQSIIAYEAIGFAIIAVAMMAVTKFWPVETEPKGVLFALLIGISGGLGGFFFVRSLQLHKASIVLLIAALSRWSPWHWCGCFSARP